MGQGPPTPIHQGPEKDGLRVEEERKKVYDNLLHGDIGHYSKYVRVGRKKGFPHGSSRFVCIRGPKTRPWGSPKRHRMPNTIKAWGRDIYPHSALMLKNKIRVKKK